MQIEIPIVRVFIRASYEHRWQIFGKVKLEFLETFYILHVILYLKSLFDRKKFFSPNK